MPRSKSSNGDGSIRPRTLSDGSVVYDITWSYRDGGRHRRGTKKGFRTEREATRFRRGVTTAVDQGTFRPPTPLTVAAWLATWLGSARKAPQTLAGYERDVYKRIIPFVGHLRLDTLDHEHLDVLYRTLETKGCPGGRGPLSPATVRNVHSTVCSALTAAVKAKKIPSSPARQATPPTGRDVKASRPHMTTWSADSVRTFLDLTSGDRLGPLWHLLLTTGMRRGEALALRWADVNLDLGSECVAVQRSLGEDRRKDSRGRRNGLVVGPPKNGKTRRIALDATTAAVLRTHRTQQSAQRLALGTRWRDTDLVFCRGTAWLKAGDTAGTLLHPDRVSESFRRSVARVGVPVMRLHDCRHTWATLALNAGVHPKVVQERLGHAHIGITLDTYSHVTPGMDHSAASLIAGLFTDPPTDDTTV